jgi:hypothetical protein
LSHDAARDVLEFRGPLLRQTRSSDGGTLFHALVEARHPMDQRFFDAVRQFPEDVRDVIDVKDGSSKQRTALAAACAAGKNAALVQQLLALGADPKVKDSDENPPLVLLGKAKARYPNDERILVQMLEHLVHAGARFDQAGAKVTQCTHARTRADVMRPG